MTTPLYDVVVPTVGRSSLPDLVQALTSEAGTELGRIVVVDDRAHPTGPLFGPGVGDAQNADPRVRVESSHGGGPAAARNVGIRASSAPWVVFVDDDVELPPGWHGALLRDLRGAARAVGGVQGRIVVPLPEDRRPTDWERSVAALETAPWITADIAYRRAALVATGGFDERFPRAYREDTDLALRVLDAGWSLGVGHRYAFHPVRPAPWWVSVGKQRGNMDDELMARLHGRRWRLRVGAPQGRARRHGATVLAGLCAVGAFALGRRRVGAGAAGLWLGLTTELAVARIAPGPRTRAEIVRMAATSVLIPPVAVAMRAWGRVVHCNASPRTTRARVDAVIVDRDGTIVVDVPYNGDPALVTPADGAMSALSRIRDAGIPLLVASNQSGVARGLLTRADVEQVNTRVEELLGPFDAMLFCPHGEADACECRKPLPGLVLRAAAIAGTEPEHCVVIGDCAADVGAAAAAGAIPILIPNRATSPEDIEGAPLLASDLETAVDYVMALGAR
jgi:histidinol-phosphate phosphatase family protein